MHVPKPVKAELGGGKKEFSLAEGLTGLQSQESSLLTCSHLAGGSFVNIEQADKFLTSGDRQSVILHFLNTIRAESGEMVGDIKFREGGAISESQW